jgi:hypothetical protein
VKLVRSALFALALLLAGASTAPAVAAAAGEDTLVLIVSADSPVARLEIIDVRKLFLGYVVMRGEVSLRAVANGSDERLQKAFLQNVIAMSEPAYEKRLLSMALQQGGRHPIVYASTQALLAAVAADPSAVSVAWARDVVQDRRVKVLRVLWRD